MEPTAPGPSQQLIAMYDAYEAAQFARDRLLDAGLTASEVDIRGESPGHVDPGYGPADEGFWNAVACSSCRRTRPTTPKPCGGAMSC